MPNQKGCASLLLPRLPKLYGPVFYCLLTLGFSTDIQCHARPYFFYLLAIISSHISLQIKWAVSLVFADDHFHFSSGVCEGMYRLMYSLYHPREAWSNWIALVGQLGQQYRNTGIPLTLKVLYFWKFTSYCNLKPLWSGMGEVVPARTSPTLHPPSPPTVHQLSRLAL